VQYPLQEEYGVENPASNALGFLLCSLGNRWLGALEVVGLCSTARPCACLGPAVLLFKNS